MISHDIMKELEKMFHEGLVGLVCEQRNGIVHFQLPSTWHSGTVTTVYEHNKHLITQNLRLLLPLQAAFLGHSQHVPSRPLSTASDDGAHGLRGARSRRRRRRVLLVVPRRLRRVGGRERGHRSRRGGAQWNALTVQPVQLEGFGKRNSYTN